MATLLQSATFISLKADGSPNALGKVYTYAAGTLTDQATYTTQAGSVANANPVILSADGTAQIWLDPALSYRIVEKTSGNTTIRDVDNVSGASSASALASTTSATGGAGLVGYAMSLAYARDTVGDRLNQLVRSFADFGVYPENTAAENDTGFAAARVWAAANAPCALVLPNGVYEYTDADNWAIEGVSLHFDFAELVCTSTTAGHTGLLIHAFEGGGGPSDPIIQQVNLSGNLIITGNSNTGYGVRWYGLGRVKNSGSIRFRKGNTTTGRAFSVEACSLCDFGQILCTTDIDSSVTYPPPKYGIYIDTGTRNGTGLGASTNNTFRQVDMAGMDSGLTIVSGDQNVFLSGAFESCTGRAVNLTSGARMNTFIGVATEANADEDIFDAGAHNQFINCYSLSESGAILGGRSAVLRGGLWERIEIQSGAQKNQVTDLTLSYTHRGSGGFFDSGTNTEWSNLYGAAFTAAFNGTVMTVSAVTAGVKLEVGHEIFVNDDAGTPVEQSTTIASLGTGTGGTGTYNLTSVSGWTMNSPSGQMSSRGVRANAYIFPLSARVSITVTSSPFTWTNNTGGWVELIYQSGTISGVTRARDGVTFNAPTVTPMMFPVGPNESVVTTYSSLPSMSYLPMNGLPG